MSTYAAILVPVFLYLVFHMFFFSTVISCLWKQFPAFQVKSIQPLFKRFFMLLNSLKTNIFFFPNMEIIV